ncbi:helix-turn-helix domain-containing protein [Streptomyces sp. NPDC058464]|uniref:helix-turn-helix domain-containing protein n=1 Tax=Streptomyces sp. NPDC058464 TaxID=3346511 RepID=UPI003658B14B
MKENGQNAASARDLAIDVVPFRPTAGSPPGAEVIDFPRLLDRAGRHGVDLSRPLRLGFHELITLEAGELHCSVDFGAYTLRPGDWLWVWPGRVVRFETDPARCDGRLLVFPTGFPNAATDTLIHDFGHRRHPVITPDTDRHAALTQVLDALAAQCASSADLPADAHLETTRSLLSVILIRLAHLAGTHGERSPGNEAFERFRRAVEEGFTRTHRVDDYATRLGYCTRTLTRATRAAAGCGAKRYIDDRVLLEAKRLLVHTALSPATISELVGFSYPTVFSAFFRKHTAMTPGEFRALAQPSAPGAVGT